MRKFRLLLVVSIMTFLFIGGYSVCNGAEEKELEVKIKIKQDGSLEIEPAGKPYDAGDLTDLIEKLVKEGHDILKVYSIVVTKKNPNCGWIQTPVGWRYICW